ncbi:MAG: hypothetical protein LW701_05905 [Fluviicola sp.]|nr:hypothetical protein [Fluviicola sp.]
MRIFNVIFFVFVHSCVLRSANYYINDATLNSDDIFTTAVGNNANNGTAASSPKATFRALWAAYGPFVDGDMIYVDAGTYTSSVGGSQTQNYGYTFTENITIIGAGNKKTIFDNDYSGIHGAYHFAEISASVTLEDIQFTKYSSNVDGQCLQIGNTGSPGVTLTNVICNTNGGSSKYATIAINSNSTVNINGGGMYCNGDPSHGASGGIDVKGSSIVLNVTNTAFIGNYKSSAATISNGAALSITVANSTTDVTYTNCLFSGSQTDHDGSEGAAIYQTTGDLVLTDCIIEYSDTYDNSTKYGGAAAFYGGTTVFTRVLVRNNTNPTGSTYGTLTTNGGDLTLTNCYFSGNTAKSAFGYGGNDVFSESGSVTATNTTFASSGNQLDVESGGSIVITNSGTPSVVNHSGTYTNNGGSPPAFTTPTVPTFSGTCPSSVVLPIELMYFNAKSSEKSNKIQWVTASEFNNNYFIVEKSNDGYLFNPIARVNGAGNSTKLNSYVIHDDELNEETEVYYRLRQVDFNGVETVSDIVSLRSKREVQKIINTINYLGQTVDLNYSGIVFDVYSDGTSLRRVQY